MLLRRKRSNNLIFEVRFIAPLNKLIDQRHIKVVLLYQLDAQIFSVESAMQLLINNDSGRVFEFILS